MKKAVTGLVRIERVPRTASPWCCSSNVCWLIPRMFTKVLMIAMGISQAWTINNTLASVMAIVTFQVVAEAQSLYRSWEGVPLRREVFTTVVAWLSSMPVLLFLAFVTKTSEIYSRAISLIWFFGAACALVAWRLAMRAIVYELRKRGAFTRSVAIAGATDIALSLAKNMVAEPYSGLRLLGFYDDRNSDRRLAVPEEYGGVLGDLNQLVTDAREGKIDIVYISLPMRAESRINALVRRNLSADMCVKMLLKPLDLPARIQPGVLYPLAKITQHVFFR